MPKRRPGTLIINFKNYPEILGRHSLELATKAQLVARDTGVRVIVAPPGPMLYAVAKAVDIPVYGQNVDEALEGKSTGAIIAESVKQSGCAGAILNHSEARIGIKSINAITVKMKELGLYSCLCAENPAEVGTFAQFGTDYIAIEPPELIGTGRAVSRAKPKVVSGSVQAAKRRGYRGSVLCGAGIVSAEDVVAATRAGAEGILVSSSVVKAVDWKKKILELAEPLRRLPGEWATEESDAT